MKKILLLSVITAFLFSCSTSNDVVSNGFLQKRKYTKGWHVNKTQKVSKKKGEIEINDLDSESQDLAANMPVSVKRDRLETYQSTVLKSNQESRAVALTTLVEPKENKITSEKKSIAIVSNSNTEVKQETTSLNIATKQVKPNKEEQLNRGGGASGSMLILLIILAFFISWLSVGIYTDWATFPTILNLIFWLFAGGIFIGIGNASIGVGFGAIAIIHALLILLGVI